MGRKKKGNNPGALAPVAATGAAPVKATGKSSRAAAPAPAAKKAGATTATVWAMAIGGAFLGLLSGLNQWPAPPPGLSSTGAISSWLGYVLGVQGLDYNHGIQGALLGLVVGGGFALSFFWSERKMLACWVLAGVGLGVGALTLHTATGAAGGFILGWLIAMTVKDKEG